MAELIKKSPTCILLVVITVLNVLSFIFLIVLLHPRCPDYDISKIGPEYHIVTTEQSSSSSSSSATQTTTVSPDVGDEPWEKEYRIPKATVPRHYDLYLFPKLEEGDYSGNVHIWIESKSPRDFFVVHRKNLNISSTELEERESGRVIDIHEPFEYKPNEFWVVRTKREVPAGNYTLKMKFTGTLLNKATGIYRSQYTNKFGEKRYFVSTIFEPVDGRSAFPCFDEPSFKSTFTTTLVRPSLEYIALSNMPVKEERPHPKNSSYTEVVFQKSVPMVTYLVCLIVCDFAYTETSTKNGVPFRVYSPPGQLQRATYAKEMGAKFLDFYEEYFNIKYPLPKQDMIALPEFPYSAMEHWGLITYKDRRLLFDQNNTSPDEYYYLTTVISHELVHNWFGNLVTLSWWDGVWLNEGFTSYIEYKALQHHFPDWDMYTQFFRWDVSNGLEVDSKLTSHPILQTVNTPEEFEEMFDDISYRKGSSILRMLESILGEEVFRKGVHNFLVQYKYDNAVTPDLWTHLSAVAPNGLNVSKIMDTWTAQMGFPVITINKRGNNYILRQDRFLEDRTATYDEKESPYKYRWEIPITYITDKQTKPNMMWFHLDEPSVTIRVPEDAEWVKFNHDFYGFYRVNYPQDNWKMFSELLLEDHNKLSPSDRAALISDAFSLAEAGLVTYDIPMDITKYLKNEEHPVPWKIAAKKLDRIFSLTYETETYPYFMKYMESLTKELFNKLGWDDSVDASLLQRQLRTTIVALSCESGHLPCLDGAVDRLKRTLNKGDYKPSISTRELVYRHGVSRTDPNTWEKMWNIYLNETNSQEKLKILFGLSFTREPWLIHRYIRYSGNSSLIRITDFFSVMAYLSSNPIARPIVWDHVRYDWSSLAERYKEGRGTKLWKMIPSITSPFSTTYQLEQLQEFFKVNPPGSWERRRKTALETVNSNIRWLSDNRDHLYQWLLKNN